MNKDIILRIQNLLLNQTYYVYFLVWPVKKCSNQNQLWETTKSEIMAEKVKFSNVNLKAVSKTLPIQHCWETIWEPIQTRDHFPVFIVTAISKPNFTWKIIQKDIPKPKVNNIEIELFPFLRRKSHVHSDFDWLIWVLDSIYEW